MKKITKNIILIIILISSFSCSSKKDEKTGAEISYINAKKLLDEKAYLEAADAFEKIDDEFPFSKWAIKGQSMAVYARYKDKDYDKLFGIVDDFLRLNPSSEYVPYMLYMKGLAYYNQIPDIYRAQDNTKEASFTFRELIARFPNSQYAIDAKEKLSFIDEHLAGEKMSVGRYNIKTENYIGAIYYFNNVISRYKLTNQAPEAYFRLAEIYYKIGLEDEAKKVSLELKVNFPESDWTTQLAKLEKRIYK